ncbi:helix-turn-helix domain-containing protein [Nocardia yamanashiensis]|uniref:PucR family transcriptional regulator n=1 Tax=Nocardia yamanashiensis TaxID=209247 RepID=UPI001E55DCF6|nr:helix-turn-helix domain-containing protein [Nocardia yamanashiensis]UGT38839.1 helix-turn-helix domain-containing protein [Nocardia yamanashiensis]
MSRRDLDAEVTAWIADFAKSMLEPDRLNAFVDRLNAEISTDLPILADDAALRRDLHASTRDALSGYVRQLSAETGTAIPIPPASRDLFRALAQRGHDVIELLRIFPAGQHAAWQTVMDAVFDQPTDPILVRPILNRMWDYVSRLLGAWSEQAVATYFEEIQQRMQGALARRIDTVHAVLRGDPVDTEAASVRLGHNLHGEQTALVVWTDAQQADAVPELETFARDLASAARTARPLTLASGPSTLWVWLATDRGTDLVAALAATAREHPGVHAAVGVPAVGPNGFRSSHTEAVSAQALAMDTGGTAAVTFYRDVELLSCMAANPTAMRAMVARELGGLAAPGNATARLRETVLLYLEHASSPRAAEILGVHKNTVLYRMQQAEELLGHGIDERKLQLEIALRLAAAYGDRVLTPTN